MVISSTASSFSLILKNGYIKGTDVCDVWYCNTLNIANYENLEISSSTETLFEDTIYQIGVYVETNFGIAVWIATGSSATINGGVYKTIKNSDYSPWQHLVCSRCNTLTINDASTIGDGSTIRGQMSGEIIVNGGNFSSTIKETVVMDSGFEGIINLNDGTCVHDSYHTIIVGSGTLNINGGTYTSEQNCALVNIFGIVNINGNSKFIASNYSAIVNSGGRK